MNRSLKSFVALAGIIAVIALTLFPAAYGQGSFQAVNGPTTVFQSLRAALLFLWLVVALGTTVTARATTACCVAALDPQSHQSTPLLC
jgi:hypothetical protein